MKENPPAKSKFKLGTVEMIALLATIIPCGLAFLTFLGYGTIRDLLPTSVKTQSTPQETAIPTLEVAPTTAELTHTPTAGLTRTPTAGLTRTPTAGLTRTPTATVTPTSTEVPLDLTGEWAGQFRDEAAGTVSDYELVLLINEQVVAGESRVIRPGDAECKGAYVLRGGFDRTTLTLTVTEAGKLEFTCNFRGSAGVEKEFTLVYSAGEGSESLKGEWVERSNAARPPKGTVEFFRKK